MKYWFKVLSPLKKPVQGTCTMGASVDTWSWWIGWIDGQPLYCVMCVCLQCTFLAHVTHAFGDYLVAFLNMTDPTNVEWYMVRLFFLQCDSCRNSCPCEGVPRGEPQWGSPIGISTPPNVWSWRDLQLRQRLYWKIHHNFLGLSCEL